MKKIRPQTWAIVCVLAALCLVLVGLSHRRHEVRQDQVQQIVEQKAPEPKKVARMATMPVESNELRFQLKGLTMAGQRPLPPAPVRERLESEKVSDQSADSVQSVQQ